MPGPLIALDKSFSRLVSCTSKTHSEGGAVRAFGPRFIERLLTYSLGRLSLTFPCHVEVSRVPREEKSNKKDSESGRF